VANVEQRQATDNKEILWFEASASDFFIGQLDAPADKVQ